MTLAHRMSCLVAGCAITFASVGVGGDAGPRQEYVAFLPLVTHTPVVVTFAVIGDYGIAGPDEAAVAGLVKSWHPDFILTTGDNNYFYGESATIDPNIGQYYADYIHPYYGSYPQTITVETNRFFPSLGNHDWNTPGAVPYLDYFTLPGNERYYDVEWGPVHVFAVDSDAREPDGIGASSAQALWLQSRLAGSTACWKLVYFHHPPFSSGLHGSNPALQWPFQGWGADAVLSGHDHLYERIVRDGFPYFVNGAGGAALYPILIPVGGSEARYNAKHGAMRVTATRTGITFQFIDIDGTAIDTLALTGGCAAP